MIQEKIESFRLKYEGDIFEEHIEYLQKALKYMQKYRGVEKRDSKYGDHYTNCPWSNDETTCGPDTCSCFFLDSYATRVNEIISRYEAYFKREQNYFKN